MIKPAIKLQESHETFYFIADYHALTSVRDPSILRENTYDLTAVFAALVARIPVAHLHGGEKTEGAFDEAMRHSITKMSHLHFVANEVYKKRVIQRWFISKTRN